MNIITKRLLNINLPANRSAFLWGPRKTGKTHWIGEKYKNSIEILPWETFLEMLWSGELGV